MPIYEFKCLKCNQKFERLIFTSISSEVACPVCGSKEVEKEYSTFASGRENPRSNAGNKGGGHSGMG